MNPIPTLNHSFLNEPHLDDNTLTDSDTLHITLSDVTDTSTDSDSDFDFDLNSPTTPNYNNLNGYITPLQPPLSPILTVYNNNNNTCNNEECPRRQ